MGSRERITEVVSKKVLEVNGRSQVHEIPGKMEQQFFLFLIERYSNQGASIIYEPHIFRIYGRNGNVESTTPDFLVETPDGTRFYIEITTRELNGKDPKKRQRRIMSHFPEVVYQILYRSDLRKIQEDNPHCSFWHSKRIRK